ncbi:HNH endonuclease [Paenibacillus sp. F411]|uniref:HNH endonuclease n=1 Tax=Paenibacillus sp. F411 TaxID=2820239 RepID=UPI001AAED8FB|nr:HNH endonuclease [Paenibacillus sp. F411]MBO2942795.1 HNH endonuclease [Paenibacillus sp. F411]
MKYFFVFQNKTYKEEKAGGFLWAPKVNKEGKTFHHWTSMMLVSKGDVIFNSYNGEMLSVIVANEDCKEAVKPAGLETVDLWEKDGWKVEAKYIDVPHPIRYKDYMDDILALQGEKYAPFNGIGRGNTGYLFQLNEEIANYLFSLVKMNPADFLAIKKDDEQLIQEAITEVESEPVDTVREQVVKSRIGQGIFKQRLRALENKCKLCGIDNPDLLKASHAKPWSVSNNSERLDQYNGFLLCPAHDILFDKGLIGFADDGAILVSPLLEDHIKMLMNVHEAMKITLLEGHKVYMKYHRDNIFKREVAN